MKNIIRTFLVSLLCSALLSCNPYREPNRHEELVINGIDDSHWTYFSFESASVVGTSLYLDDEQDAAWAKRSDWDFAVCGDFIKTNGGTSGEGLAAAQVNKTSSFDALKQAPTEGYLVDTLFVTYQ